MPRDVFFIQHKADTDVKSQAYDALLEQNKIGIHYTNSESFDSADYPSQAAQTCIRYLNELHERGGIICAQFPSTPGYVVAEVRPGAIRECVKSHAGQFDGDDHIVLKTVEFDPRTRKNVTGEQAIEIQLQQPRGGTLCKLDRGAAFIRLIAEAVAGSIRPELQLLSSHRREAMCAEYLRLEEGEDSLKMLSVPVGRTMQFVDIMGITSHGRKVYGQVTDHTLAQCLKKDRSGRSKFGDVARFAKETNTAALYLFCNHHHMETIAINGSSHFVSVIPLQTVYSKFVAHTVGRKWLKAAFSELFGPLVNVAALEFGEAESAAVCGRGN